jgi:hypothetical protein
LRALVRCKRLEEEVMREVRVLRGMGPPYIPREPETRTCLGQDLDMSG